MKKKVKLSLSRKSSSNRSRRRIDCGNGSRRWKSGLERIKAVYSGGAVKSKRV